MKKDYDVIIVGAGPAGMFAAYTLADSKKRVCLIEMGKPIKERTKQDAVSGIGGAGTFSDGKLHFSPVLSHEKILHLYTVQEYKRYLNMVDKVFKSFGVDCVSYPKDKGEVEKLVDEAKLQGIQLFIREIKHVGSDLLPQVVTNFEEYMVKKGVEIKTRTEVADIIIKNNRCLGVKTKDGTELNSKFVVLSPGRVGARWLQKLSEKHSIKYDYEKIEVGVRMEFPATIMSKHAKLMYEAIFMMHPPTFDDPVRTFCPCPNGMVSTEQYDGFVCVNGHSNSNSKTENSNFALVTEITLTEPLENTTKYGKSIGKLATTIGGGKPIIQRLSDLKKGRRSTWERIRKSFVEPSLKEVSPGDIAMALPHRIVTDLLEAIEMLERVLPGINSGDNLLYAPEIKFRASKIRTNKYLETGIENLFVAGDGPGLSGNIVGAAATGMMAAEGILKKEDGLTFNQDN